MGTEQNGKHAPDGTTWQGKARKILQIKLSKPASAIVSCVVAAALVVTLSPSITSLAAQQANTAAATAAAEKAEAELAELQEELGAEAADDAAADTAADAGDAVTEEEATTEDPTQADAASGDAASSAPEDADAPESADEPSAVSAAASDAPSTQQADAAADAVDAADATDAADAYPAAKFTGKANGITVSVEAPEGALPQGAQMHVTAVKNSKVKEAVEDAVDNVTGMTAIDITFTTKDGTEVEPLKKIEVSFKSDAIAAADGDDAKSIEVVHISDNGDASVVKQDNAGTAANEVAINSKDFSIYVVVETGINAKYTVTFVSGEDPIASMQFEDEDAGKLDKIIYDPGIGTNAKHVVFKGWTTKGAYTTSDAKNGKTIGQVREEVAKMYEDGELHEGGIVYYYAMLFKNHFVSYRNEAGVTISTDEALQRWDDADALSYEFKLDYTPDEADTHKFEGWGVVDAKTGLFVDENNDNVPDAVYKSGAKTNLDKDIIVKPYVTVGNWITFKENGGSYTAPEFVRNGEATQGTGSADRPNPTRFGYDFDGWYTDQECTTKFTFGQELTENITLYAKWKAQNQANYTVIIWKQNVDGKTYDFEEALNFTGNTNEKASAVSSAGTGNDKYARVGGVSKQYTGFHLDKYDTDVAINPDGTSVVNVYYNRNKITLKFMVRSNGPWKVYATMTGLYGTTLKDNGYTWPTQYNWYTWPTQYNWYTEYNNSYTSGYYGSGTRITFLDAFLPADSKSAASSSITYYGFSAETDRTVIFYKQAADNTYEEANRVSASSGTFNISDKYNGFMAYQYRIDGKEWLNVGTKDNTTGYYGEGVSGNYKTLEIRYNRHSYPITYMDGKCVGGDGVELEDHHAETINVSADIAFGADISSYNEGGSNYYTPAQRHDGFMFDGWYLDSACTQKAELTTMALGGIVVYAKWIQKQYRVFLHPNVPAGSKFEYGDSTQKTSFRVNYGAQISEGNTINMMREDYEFVGWYTDEACTQSFNFPTFVANDQTVTAAYDKTRSTETDEWGNVEAGKESVNSDAKRFWVTGQLDLYAKWRSKLEGARGIQIVYDANGGTGAPTDSLFYSDSSEATAGAASASAIADQKFAGWVVQIWNKETKQFEDTKTVVAPGQNFTVLRDYARVQDIPADQQKEDGITKTYTIQLKASYTDPETIPVTHITYDPNGAAGSRYDISTVVVDDASHKLMVGEVQIALDANDAPLSYVYPQAGYVFAGWNTMADGSGTTIQAGQNIAADYNDWPTNSEDNILYAQWAQPVEVVVTGKTVYRTYNGTEQTYDALADTEHEGYEVTYRVAGKEVTELPAGVTVNVSGTVSGKDAGTYEAEKGKYVLKVDSKVEGEAAGKYAVTNVTIASDAKLVITKRQVTLTSASDSKEYNGSALTNHNVTAGGEGFVDGEGATYDVIGSQTNPGSSENEFTYTLNSGTKASNYDITTAFGTLTVRNRGAKYEVEVNAKSSEVFYDGNDHSASVAGLANTTTIKVSNKNVEAVKVTVGNQPYYVVGLSSGILQDSAVDAGQYEVVVTGTYTVYDRTNPTYSSHNVTANFNVKSNNGTLSIKPRTVELTSASDSKPYDGTPLTNHTVTATPYDGNGGHGFVDGEGATYYVTGSQTSVGESSNAFTYTLNSNTKESNYNITKNEGKLTVTKLDQQVKVTIQGNTATDTYDGTEKAVAGYTVTSIQVGSDIYSGATLNNGPYKTNDFSFSGTAEAKGTNAGSYAMGLTKGNFANGNPNIDDANVTFVVEDGSLTINPRPVTVAVDNKTVTYNGAEQSGYGAADGELKFEGLLEGDWARIDYTPAKGTNAGTYENGAFNQGTFKVAKDGADITDNYTLAEAAPGNLTIDPVKDKVTVTIKGNKGTKVYDGTEQSVTAYTFEATDNLYQASDFSFSGDATAKGTDAGEYSMGLKASQFTNTSGNFEEVEFVVEDGALTIQKRTVTIVSGTDTREYNGQPLTARAKVAEGSAWFIESDAVTYEATGSVTNVADENNGQEGNNGIKVTFGKEGAEKNYTVVEQPGTLTVTARKVTLTSATDSKVYDGTVLTNSTVTVTGDFIGGDKAECDVTGSQKRVGSSANAFTYKLVGKDGAELSADAAKNYEVTKAEGTLTVTNRDAKYAIEVVGNSSTVYYNGADQTAEGFETLSFTVDGQVYTVSGLTHTAKGTDVGTYIGTITGTPVVKDTDGEDVSSEFAVTTKAGTLTINKRAVTLTSGSDSKIYDGTALTNSEVTATALDDSGNGFVSGEGATYNVTGTQTNAGTSKNTFTYTLSNGTKASNYNITMAEGDLTVNPVADTVTVTIAENSGSAVYDGQAHTVEGYTVKSISNPLYAESDFAFTGDAAHRTVTETNAGTYNLQVVPGDFTNNSTNFANVQFVVEDGTLVIGQRSITFAGRSDTHVYDGAEHSVSGYDVTSELGLAEGHDANVEASAARTIVGTTTGTITAASDVRILDAGNNDVTANYQVTTIPGAMTITDRPVGDKLAVALVANSGEFVYDGEVKTVSGFQNSNNVTVADDGTITALVNGKTFTVSGLTSAHAQADAVAGYEIPITGTAKVVDEAGNDVTSQFDVTTTPGTFTINPAAITLTSDGGEHVYDGNAFTKPNVTVAGEEKAAAAFNAQVSELKATGSVTDVDDGTMTNTITYTAGTGFKADNYTITTTEGTLTVTPRPVTLKSADLTQEYNGSALVNGETALATEEGWVEGQGATYEFTGSQTLVGSSENTFSYTLNENTKAANYTITAKPGLLTVTNRAAQYQVTVTAGSAEVYYDGNEHNVITFAEGTKTVGNLVNVTVDNHEYYIEGLNVGVSGGAKTDVATKMDGENEVVDEAGYEVVITGSPKVYDAANNGNDVTAQFNVTFEKGALKINPRTVTLTSATAEKAYDGMALTNSEVIASEFNAATGTGFVEGEGATYNVTGSQTLVGSSENTFTHTLSEGTKASNYNITQTPGTLTVTGRAENNKLQAAVTANSGGEKYNGGEQAVSGFTVNAVTAPWENGPQVLPVTVGGVQFYIGGLSASATGTNAGTYTAAVNGTEVVYDADGNDVTAQFTVSKTPGALTIDKCNVTLTSASAEKQYDGNALVKNAQTDVTVDGDGFVGTEGATYSITGSQTIPGESDNEFTYALNEGTLAGNYEISTAFGKLKVTDRAEKFEITVEANSGTFTYDGTEKTAEGFKTLSFGIDNNTYTVEGLAAKASGTNAGTYTNAISGTAVVKDSNGNDVTAQFAVNATNGKLVINKCTVTLISKDGSWTYDGMTHENTTVEVTGDGFVAGEVENVRATGSVADVTAEPVVNAITYDKTAKFNEDNYNITVNESGRLTVTKREVTLTSASLSKQYDGNALTNATESATAGEGFSFASGNWSVAVSGAGFVEGQGASYTFTGSRTLVGNSDNTFTYVLNEGTKAENYSITLVPGTLNVVNRDTQYEITVVANGGSYVYDGSAKSASGFEALEFTVDGNTYTVSGLTTSNPSSTDVATLTNTISGTAVVADAAGNNVTDQFAVRTTNGRLAVTARPITVTATSAQKPYDGKALTANSFTHNTQVIAEGVDNGVGLVSGQNITASISGSQTIVGTSDNVASNAVITANGANVTSNYTVIYTPGMLEVTPLAEGQKLTATVTAASDTKTYNGGTQELSGFDSTGTQPGKITPAGENQAELDARVVAIDGVNFYITGLSAMAEGKDVAEYTNTVAGTPVVYDAAGNNVTDQFTVNTADGKLTITKAPLTLASATLTKQYDGTPLVNGETALKVASGWQGSDGASYTFAGTRTVVGGTDEHENTFTVVPNEGTKLENYNITQTAGDLIVTDRTSKYAVAITANSGTFTYNGESHSVSGFEDAAEQGVPVTADNGLTYYVSGLTSELEMTDVRVNGGEVAAYGIPVTGRAVVKDAAGNDVTAQFKVNVTEGTLTINPVAVTLTSQSDSKKYDGSALTSTDVTVSGEGASVFNAQTTNLRATGSVTNVADGAVTNGIVYTEAAGFAERNYQITKNEGKLSITSRTVQMTSATLTKVYDGTALTNKLQEGVTAEAGFEYADGAWSVAVAGDGFANGEHATYEFTGTRTVVGGTGEHQNAFTYKLVDANGRELSDAAQQNYTVADPVFGDLVVTSRPVGELFQASVTAASSTVTYNGSVQTVSGFDTQANTVNDDGSILIEVNGQTYRITGLAVPSASGTDVVAASDSDSTTVDGVAYGSYPAVIAAEGEGMKVLDAQGNDVTDQFNITLNPGKLVITPATVTLVSADLSKTYDGDALVNGDEPLATQTGWARGEGATYDFTGSQLVPGSSANAFTYTLNADTKAGNYIINKTEGTLTVNDRGADELYAATATANGGTFTYDAAEHTVSGVAGADEDGVVSFEAENGKTYYLHGLTAQASGTDAGSYQAALDSSNLTVRDASGNDVTSQFAFTGEDGELTISPRDVIVTLHSLNELYDGTAHVGGFDIADTAGKAYAYDAEAGYAQLEGDDTAGITPTSITNAGSMPNEVGMTFLGEQGVVMNVLRAMALSDGPTAKPGNYNVTAVAGEDGSALTINPRQIVLTSASATKAYDGTPLTDYGITQTGDGFVEGQGVNYTFGAGQTEVGTSPNTFSIAALDGTDLNNYVVTSNFGTLEVTAADTTIGDDATPLSDGTGTSDDESGDDATIDDEETARAAGSGAGDDDTQTVIEDNDTATASNGDSDGNGAADSDTDSNGKSKSGTVIGDEETPLGSAVRTGDQAPLALGGIAGLAVAAGIAMLVIRRRGNRDEQ